MSRDDTMDLVLQTCCFRKKETYFLVHGEVKFEEYDASSIMYFYTLSIKQKNEKSYSASKGATGGVSST